MSPHLEPYNYCCIEYLLLTGRAGRRHTKHQRPWVPIFWILWIKLLLHLHHNQAAQETIIPCIPLDTCHLKSRNYHQIADEGWADKQPCSWRREEGNISNMRQWLDSIQVSPTEQQSLNMIKPIWFGSTVFWASTIHHLTLERARKQAVITYHQKYWDHAKWISIIILIPIGDLIQTTLHMMPPSWESRRVP